MALERKKLVHGVVIRVSGDTGQQIGAHVEYVERITDGDEIISAKMLPPEPLATGADALRPLIGEVVIAQQAELEALRGEVEALTDERTELLARIEALTPTESA